MSGRILCAALAIVVGLAVAGERYASAQPMTAPERASADVRARELFQKGDTAYAEGRYEEAHASFQEAYELSGRPQFLYNLSNALERLGRYSEAVEALEKYLASGKARDRDVVQKRLANLRRRVDEQKKSEERAREEDERKRANEDKQRAEKRAAENVADPSPRPVPTPLPRGKPTRVLPIFVLGTGAVALATGGVFGLLTISARGDVAADCKVGPNGRLCSSDAATAIDRDKTFGLVADIAFASGVVLAGVGVYLLLSSDRDEEPYLGVGGVGGVGGRSAVRKKMRLEARPMGSGVEVVGTF